VEVRLEEEEETDDGREVFGGGVREVGRPSMLGKTVNGSSVAARMGDPPGLVVGLRLPQPLKVWIGLKNSLLFFSVGADALSSSSSSAASFSARMAFLRSSSSSSVSDSPPSREGDKRSWLNERTLPRWFGLREGVELGLGAAPAEDGGVRSEPASGIVEMAASFPFLSLLSFFPILMLLPPPPNQPLSMPKPLALFSSFLLFFGPVCDE
jgi:hypothetical protein